MHKCSIVPAFTREEGKKERAIQIMTEFSLNKRAKERSSQEGNGWNVAFDPPLPKNDKDLLLSRISKHYKKHLKENLLYDDISVN